MEDTVDANDDDNITVTFIINTTSIALQNDGVSLYQNNILCFLVFYLLANLSYILYFFYLFVFLFYKYNISGPFLLLLLLFFAF